MPEKPWQPQEPKSRLQLGFLQWQRSEAVLPFLCTGVSVWVRQTGSNTNLPPVCDHLNS